MTWERNGMDWDYVRGAVAFFVAAAATAAVLLSSACLYEQRMEQEFQHAGERLRAAGDRYRALDEEEQLVKDYLPAFTALGDTGLLGEEQRLNWVEVLQEAGAGMGLPSLAYEISARRPYPAGFPLPPGNYGVFVSEMILDLQLLHEGDLFALLALLDERGRGLHTVSACELTRNAARPAADLAVGNIAATCTLQWFSLKPGSGA